MEHALILHAAVCDMIEQLLANVELQLHHREDNFYSVLPPPAVPL